MAKPFEPSLIRTNRVCCSDNCSHAALFFPWIEVFQIDSKKTHPLQIECPKQYCQACMEKIKRPDDMGDTWRSVVSNAEKKWARKFDPSTAVIHWMPLIIGEQILPLQVPRLHD